MSGKIRNHERGVALILTLLALMILSAIAATLVTMSATETTVNTNYRSEEVAFFAARAGLYEATDRMMQGSTAGSIAAQIPNALPGGTCPGATCGVLYLINQTNATGTVAPWNINNAYADDELCHEGYTIGGMSSQTPDVPCTTLPNGSSWYTTVPGGSNAPWSGTTAAMPCVWVRVAMKVNDSSSYIAGPSDPYGCASQTSCYNSVDATQGGVTAGTPVCWNGVSEVLMPTTSTTCGQVNPGPPPTAYSPVYVVTALAVTSTGARQMVQTEVALPPPTVIATPGGPADPDGFFAVSNVCSASASTSPFDIAGNASTDGYTSANGGTYSSTQSNALGSIGSNGSVGISGHSTHVGGNVHVKNPTNANPLPVNGLCPASEVYTNGGPTYGGPVAISTYVPIQPCPPNGTGCPVGVTDESISSAQTLVPGNYRNINVSTPHGILTLTGPGVYNINCLNVGSNSTLQISPPTTQVVINVTGTLGANCAAPVSLSGNSVTNTSGIAANLMINYGGTQTLTITGGASAYYVLNAPNAPVTIHGGSDLYGAVVAYTIDDSGGVNLHFDNSLNVDWTTPSTTSTATSTSNYSSISLRSLQY